ncbi:MAG: hypothetical protein AAB426_14405, partial [Myxococcota bacterium]
MIQDKRYRCGLRARVLVLACVTWLLPPTARGGETRTFAAGSLVVPMDLAYQDRGTLQAYGLVFQLLRQGVPVAWVIAPDKVWHAKACSDPTDSCPWDCAEEGSGIKCTYPTASPDFYVGARVFWNGSGQRNPGTLIAQHGYRGGPFVIEAHHADTARTIVDAWNQQSQTWAQRVVVEYVAVHEATAAFDSYVAKAMFAAPTIAVFSDGNETIATSYLRAAGIKQSNGNEFPNVKCGVCGPSTVNPDMLTVEAVMGPMGTCGAPNVDHKNGALFTSDGVPGYCQIMSMHWDVDKGREKVQCGGANCPATQALCAANTPITYHGHEVVAEVRSFLNYPTHLFAECQAVNAYENSVPNPAWPYLDDAGRLGHYLTTRGDPPSCLAGSTCPAGADTAVACVLLGCDSGTRDCCLPTSSKEKGAGFLIGAQPSSSLLKTFHPELPYNQRDGGFATTGGSEPSYNLSTYLQTAYINGRDVTFLTGPNGPGSDDVWMTGYLDGACEIFDEGGELCGGVGKVSYLGGHSYGTTVPLSTNPASQGARMFLNALFEADCVTSVGQPAITTYLEGETRLVVTSLPVTRTYTSTWLNGGLGAALDATLTLDLPASTAASSFEQPGAVVGGDVAWTVGTIGTGYGMPGDPLLDGSRWASVRFDVDGTYALDLSLSYRVGVTTLQTYPQRLTVRVVLDTDGDGVADSQDADPADPDVCGDHNADGCDDCAAFADQDADGVCDLGDADPSDPFTCGDSDGDTCEDCTLGHYDPAADGADLDLDGLCDVGDADIDGDGAANGVDIAPSDRFACLDGDADGCDDCVVAGAVAPTNDGPDANG